MFLGFRLALTQVGGDHDANLREPMSHELSLVLLSVSLESGRALSHCWECVQLLRTDLHTMTNWEETTQTGSPG